MITFRKIAAYHLANGSYYSDGHGSATLASRLGHGRATAFKKSWGIFVNGRHSVKYLQMEH